MSRPFWKPFGNNSYSADWSAIVDMSPKLKSFMEALRRILRIVLPDLVLGSCFKQLILSGVARAPILCRTRKIVVKKSKH